MNKYLKKSVNSVHTNEKMAVTEDNDKPLPPFNLVALVWILSSKAEGIDYEKFVENYLYKILCNEKFGGDFSNNILPSVYAVAAKISIQRNRIREKFKKLEELQEIKLKNLDKIYDVGSSVKGILSRLMGIIGGAATAVGIGISLDVHNPLNQSFIILIGIVSGYLLIEFLLWIYKSHESERIHDNTELDKKNIWDNEFTTETHIATMILYQEAIEFNKKYDSKRYKKRDQARDLQKIAQMFLERPSLDKGPLSTLIKFLDVSIQIEDKLRKYVDKKYHDDFKEFAKKQDERNQNKINNDKKYNPKKRGLKILSNFLSQKGDILSDKDFKDIMDIRNTRKEIIKYAKYDRLTDILEVAENTLKSVNQKLKPIVN